MSDKMQPGRFTLRFNVLDPQRREAVDILNRLGRQKAQYIAQALIHYTECSEAAHKPVAGMMDRQPLEQAILAVLAEHPELLRQERAVRDTTEERPSPHMVQTGEQAPVWDDFMSDESLDAINKTLAAFRSR